MSSMVLTSTASSGLSVRWTTARADRSAMMTRPPSSKPQRTMLVAASLAEGAGRPSRPGPAGPGERAGGAGGGWVLGDRPPPGDMAIRGIIYVAAVSGFAFGVPSLQ